MCIGIIAKDAVVAIIEDIIIPATVTAITVTETMLTLTTILATEAEALAMTARRVLGSIRGMVEPAAVAGTV